MATAAYNIVDLGDLGGGESGAHGINDMGQVVGFSHRPDFSRHAFLWQNGAMTDLGTLGGSESFARAVNDVGQVVGYSQLPGDLLTHAFLWQNGVMTDLDTLGPDTIAWGVNDVGQVVGYSVLSSDTLIHAFLWQNGMMTDLGTLGGRVSRATDINAAGQVVGDSYLPGDQGFHAFLWQNGAMVSLGTLGGLESFALAINDAGQVVGYSHLPGGSSAHAFLWQNGVMTDLGTLGGSLSYATGINEAGQVVGGSWLPGDQVFHAFLWQNGVMTDLGALGASSVASDINNLGQISGESFDPPILRGVLWTPGGCTTQVTVGPVVQLWPPDHTMRSFRLSDCASASDSCGGSVDIDARGIITSIFSDEPEDAPGNGDGHTVGDIAITGASSFSLRSERQGRGNGRVYGVSFTVADDNGATQTATCHLAVPHDRSGSSAVNDGAGSGYTVSP